MRCITALDYGTHWWHQWRDAHWEYIAHARGLLFLVSWILLIIAAVEGNQSTSVCNMYSDSESSCTSIDYCSFNGPTQSSCSETELYDFIRCPCTSASSFHAPQFVLLIVFGYTCMLVGPMLFRCCCPCNTCATPVPDSCVKLFALRNPFTSFYLCCRGYHPHTSNLSLF